MKKKIVIVGGVAGGASCAARARRMMEDAEIIILEKGPYASFANCGLPYYLGGVIKERDKLLVAKPEMFRQRFRIDLRTRHEALRIDRVASEVEVREVETGRVYRESYTHLVLSPGASPLRPPLPGLDTEGVFTLRDIPDTDAIDLWLKENQIQKAVVVGGGYIGLEMAENLRHRGLDVTLVELLPQVMPFLDAEMAAMIHKELKAHGVDLKLGRKVVKFNADGSGRLAGVALDDGQTIDAGLAILGIGVRPNVELAREAGLDVQERGGIKVNAHMQTNDLAIYAVGDAVETPNIVTGRPMIFALAGPANRQGRIAADHIAGRADAAYRGSQGTAICKIFDLDIGITGLSEAALRKQGVQCQAVHIRANSHAGYYPGAMPVTIKLVYAPADGRLLGAQAAGCDGVDKRLDVLATALRARMTVFDLEHLELAYAPPYGSAKDPVNIAGFAAANSLRGDSPLAHWDELDELTGQGAVVLDVRNAPEVAAGKLPQSRLIPLDQLRDRVNELPMDRPILVHCAGGQRSYYAVRLLRQRGLDARNLSGGFGLYELFQSAQ